MRPLATFLLILAAVAMTVSTVRGVSERLFLKERPAIVAPGKAKPVGLWV